MISHVLKTGHHQRCSVDSAAASTRYNVRHTTVLARTLQGHHMPIACAGGAPSRALLPLESEEAVLSKTESIALTRLLKRCKNLEEIRCEPCLVHPS